MNQLRFFHRRTLFLKSAVSLLAVAALFACDGRFVTQGGSSSEAGSLSETAHFITNGTLSPSGWQDAALAIDYSGWGSICTATLITKTLAVTAAHCVYLKNCKYDPQTGKDYDCELETDARKFTLLAGQNVNVPKQRRTVTKVIGHADYDDEYLTNDIALLKFDTPFDGIAPIPALPEREGLALSEADKGLDITYTGYGLDENGEDPGMRLTVDGTIYYVCKGPRFCTFKYEGEELYAPPRTFCSMMTEGGTCNGDSGGPGFIVKSGVTYAVGANSFGDQNCALYGCATDISAYGSWIAEYLEDGLALGEECVEDSQCSSGFCAEGVCCDAECSDTLCMSCRESRGAAQDGICSPIVACDGESDCRQAGSCDSATGRCVYPPKADNTVCDDGNACTLDDFCFDGACVNAGSVFCQPPGECQAPHSSGETCDSRNGACLYDNLPDGTSCSAGICQNGVCEKSSSGGGCSQSDGSSFPLSPALFILAAALSFSARRRIQPPRNSPSRAGFPS